MENAIEEKFKQVKSACSTLDKVTIARIPYTVLLTYFFWDGRIHCTLNSLHVMSTKDYDAN